MATRFTVLRRHPQPASSVILIHRHGEPRARVDLPLLLRPPTTTLFASYQDKARDRGGAGLLVLPTWWDGPANEGNANAFTLPLGGSSKTTPHVGRRTGESSHGFPTCDAGPWSLPPSHARSGVFNAALGLFQGGERPQIKPLSARLGVLRMVLTHFADSPLSDSIAILRQLSVRIASMERASDAVR